MSSNETPSPPASSRRNPSRCPASSPATPRSARSGRSGNDLHYRGYDILELADQCEFEEIAHLLVHGKLPNAAELAGYKAKLIRLRGLPDAVQMALQALPASSHPMDVLRTGTLGARLHAAGDRTITTPQGARDIADRLLACLGSMLLLLVPLRHAGRRHRRRDRRRLDRRALPAPAARQAAAGLVGAGDARFAHPLRRARVQRLDLHRPRDRRHRLGPLFVHHRRHRRAARTEARRRQRSRLRDPEALRTPDEAEADIRARVERKEVVIGFGHPVYTVSDPRNDVIKEVAREPVAPRPAT